MILEIITGTSAREKPTADAPPDPGWIDAAGLAQYWRKESAAAARRMALRLGTRCVVGQYPWFAIWSSEGLAPPPKTYWAALKGNHLATDDVAAMLACDARTVRRYVLNPPKDFPRPVFESGKPWLWRACQIHAYVSGLPVPLFRSFAHIAKTQVAARDDRPDRRSSNTFDPFSSG